MDHRRTWKIPLLTSILHQTHTSSLSLSLTNTHTHTNICPSQSCHVSGSQHLPGHGPDTRVRGGLRSGVSALLDRSVSIWALRDIKRTFDPNPCIVHHAWGGGNNRSAWWAAPSEWTLIECPPGRVWEMSRSFSIVPLLRINASTGKHLGEKLRT